MEKASNLIPESVKTKSVAKQKPFRSPDKNGCNFLFLYLQKTRSSFLLPFCLLEIQTNLIPCSRAGIVAAAILLCYSVFHILPLSSFMKLCLCVCVTLSCSYETYELYMAWEICGTVDIFRLSWSPVCTLQ